jgi:hypothetical protein
MTLDPGLTAGILGVLTGVVSATARWALELTQGYWRLIACYLLFILIGGGCMGIAGSALARLTDCPQWADVVSGALGASAVIGFDTVIWRVLGGAGT